MDERLRAAAGTYLDRRDGRDVPEGTTDDDGIWQPSPKERRVCCELVNPRDPLLHCRTNAHVAMLFGVDPHLLLQAARQLEREKPARFPRYGGK